MGLLGLIWFAVENYALWVTGLFFQPVFWVASFVLFNFYRRNEQIQRVVYKGEVKHNIFDMFFRSLFFGLIAGLISSIIITVLGISFYNYKGIEYIILLSLILMLLNRRYICLSYSGGIIGLLSLLTSDLINIGLLSKNSGISGFIYNNINIDISSLMAIVGIMHLMESLLMYIDGVNSSIPVYMKKKGELIGAFVMQRYWIIPFLLYFITFEMPSAGDVVSTPSWWPLIKPSVSPELFEKAILMAAPIFAVLGYGDFAVAEKPKDKVRRSAKGLLIFSVLLILISFISTMYHPFMYAAVIFAPVCHEILILHGRKIENNGEPIYKYSQNGIIILDIMPSSILKGENIGPGDRIIGINNNKINDFYELQEFLLKGSPYLWIEVLEESGNVKTIEVKNYSDGINDLGILTVPKNEAGIPIVEDRESFLNRLWDKLKGKR